MKSIENIKESVDSDDDTATDLQGNLLKSIDNCLGAALKASISKKNLYFNFYNSSPNVGPMYGLPFTIFG